MTRALLVLSVVPAVALAEPSWLVARGRLVRETGIEAFVGTRSLGLGLVRTDTNNARAGVVVEAVVGLVDRASEVRAARTWQFTQTRFATATASLGGTAILVPDRRVDAGLGPQAQLALSLGGRVFTVELGLQTGMELFLRQTGGPRFTERASLGLCLRLWEFTVSAMARLGADLFVDRPFVGRGELMVSVGWWGIDGALGRPTPTESP